MGPVLGTAYTREAGLCHVRQLKPGSATMVLEPVDYHDHYTDKPLLRHRSNVDWRSVSTHKESA